jgi:hypothetical protein
MAHTSIAMAFKDAYNLLWTPLKARHHSDKDQICLREMQSTEALPTWGIVLYCNFEGGKPNQFSNRHWASIQFTPTLDGAGIRDVSIERQPSEQ